MSKVTIARTGTANTASVIAAFRRLGVGCELTSDPEAAASAELLVLPGVGAFGAAMEELRRTGLDEALRARVLDGRPTLCICLGMQLLCEESEESPDVRGLGVIPSRITRFPNTVRVPQLGWNHIEADPACQHLESGHVYFANSYRLVDAPAGWNAAVCDYAGPFIAAVERRGVLACQFHPELSGAFGQALLRRWLVGERAAC